MQRFQRVDGIIDENTIAAAPPTQGSMDDGFTISLTVNSNNTWSASSTGLSTEISKSGTLNNAGTLYADVAERLVAKHHAFSG